MEPTNDITKSTSWPAVTRVRLNRISEELCELAKGLSAPDTKDTDPAPNPLAPTKDSTGYWWWRGDKHLGVGGHVPKNGPFEWEPVEIFAGGELNVLGLDGGEFEYRIDDLSERGEWGGECRRDESPQGSLSARDILRMSHIAELERQLAELMSSRDAERESYRENLALSEKRRAMLARLIETGAISSANPELDSLL